MIKFSIVVALITLLSGSIVFAQPSGSAVLASRADSVAYAFGISIGEDLKRAGIEQVNTEVLAMAVAQALTGDETNFDPALVRELITQTVTVAKQQMDERLKNDAQAFMESNQAKEGVNVTASGLQYEVIRDGEGEKPTTIDTVTVHYRGQLSDGKVFDSSYDRGEPITFALGRVITGWQEGLQLMSAGAHYRIVVPYELAYGEQGAPPDIPPFSPLVFEIELIAVKKADAGKPETGELINESVR